METYCYKSFPRFVPNINKHGENQGFVLKNQNQGFVLKNQIGSHDKAVLYIENCTIVRRTMMRLNCIHGSDLSGGCLIILSSLEYGRKSTKK